MPYVRCDVNCKPKTQPGHYDVTQQESCLTYENYNKDYIRTDSECNPITQPDILEGWNGDYIRVKTDGTKIVGLSQQMVEQTLYVPRDVKNQSVPFTCYNEPPLFFRTVDLEKIYLAMENGADYYFEDESGNRILIELEINTFVNPNFLHSNDENQAEVNEIDQFLMTMTGEYIVDEAEDRYVRLNNL